MAQGLQDVGGRVARGAGTRQTLEALGRAGFVAKGVVFAIIAVLALLLAAGAGGGTTDQSGALQTLADEPGGTALLVLLGLGLAAYGVWRVVASALDRDAEGDDAPGIATRIGTAASGLAYLALAALAFALAAGAGAGLGRSQGGGSGGGSPGTAAGVLDWPAGPWIVGAAGVVAIGVGGYQAWDGIAGGFMEDMDRARMRTERSAALVRAAGTVGRLAMAVVLGLIGAFLIRAAVQHDPSEAKGLDGVLQTIAGQPYGRALLALIAAGLLGYAVFCIVQARYRRM